MKKIEELLELVRQLPEGLRSGWLGCTSNFELMSPSGPYLWVGDICEECNTGELTDGSEVGQRLGLIMDIAEAVKAAQLELEIAARPVKVYTRPEFSIDPRDYEDEDDD